MRALRFLSALVVLALANPALSQTPDARPALAVVVLTLDEARQGQIKHGRQLIAALGDERFGSLRLVDPTIPLDEFGQCEDDSPEYRLSFCVRFLLHRSMTAESPPHVVVVFDDRGPGEAAGRERGDMRALCFGRGAEAADPKAQDIWLWTGSARIHGVRDWDRDTDALAACIRAALAEPPAEPPPG